MGNLIDRMIRLEREQGIDNSSYIDRIIAEDYDAAKEEGRAVGKMRSASSVVGKAVGDYIKAAEKVPLNKRKAAFNNSDSPLEHALAFALMRMSDIVTISEPGLNMDAVRAEIEKRDSPVLLFQQPVVACYDNAKMLGSYRLDFLLSVKSEAITRLLCVEVDGASFHHGNIDQVTRDYRRNSHLLIEGIETIRFTGREVHYDIEACLNVISLVIRKWLAEKNG